MGGGGGASEYSLSRYCLAQIYRIQLIPVVCIPIMQGTTESHCGKYVWILDNVNTFPEAFRWLK